MTSSTTEPDTVGSAAHTVNGLLTVTVHHPRPSTVLVRAHGELDLATAARLRAPLNRAVRGPGPASGLEPHRVVCDLSGVDFLAAAGVDVLAGAGRAAAEQGSRVHLIVGTRPVRRALTLCGLDRELPLHTRLHDALGDTILRGLADGLPHLSAQ